MRRGRPRDHHAEGWSVNKFVEAFMIERYGRKLQHSNYYIKEFDHASFLMFNPADDDTEIIAAWFKPENTNGDTLPMFLSGRHQAREVLQDGRWNYPFKSWFPMDHPKWEANSLDVTKAKVLHSEVFRTDSSGGLYPAYLVGVEDRVILADILPGGFHRIISRNKYVSLQDIPSEKPEDIDGFLRFLGTRSIKHRGEVCKLWLLPCGEHPKSISEAREILIPKEARNDRSFSFRGLWFAPTNEEAPEFDHEKAEKAKMAPVARAFGISDDTYPSWKGVIPNSVKEFDEPLSKLAVDYGIEEARKIRAYVDAFKEWKSAFKYLIEREGGDLINWGGYLADKTTHRLELGGDKKVFRGTSGDICIEGSIQYGYGRTPEFSKELNGTHKILFPNAKEIS